MYILSSTTGNKLFAVKTAESFWRKIFFLPHIKIRYVGTTVKGLCVCERWYKPADIFY